MRPSKTLDTNYLHWKNQKMVTSYKYCVFRILPYFCYCLATGWAAFMGNKLNERISKLAHEDDAVVVGQQSVGLVIVSRAHTTRYVH